MSTATVPVNITPGLIIYGTRPKGSATGTERWATVRGDDGDVRITAYRGWGILDEVTLRGPNAGMLSDSIARQLVTA